MTLIKQTLSEQGILTLTLNRPDKLNALSQPLLEVLWEVLSDAKNNPQVKGLILTGEGKAFCAGADISRLAECNVASGLEFAKYGQNVFRTLETLGKPSIAAVNGYAFGGGCELCMAATLRIASEDAQFGQPEVKLGVIPGYGGTQRLARLVGKGRALELCLTGRFITAQTAYDWGLIAEVTPKQDLLARAVAMLQQILAMSPTAVAATIEAIDKGYDLSLEDALAFEALQFARTCSTQDKQEGVSAFLEKRSPHFKGV